MEKVKVGISIGDINGIGVEVILKTLHHKEILKYCIPVIYGSSKVLSYHKNIVGLEDFSYSTASSAERAKHDRVNVINCWHDSVNITLGKLSEAAGQCAYIALEQATNDLKSGAIDALVTAPIHKKAMQAANFPHTGHTEYITQAFGMTDSLMLMVNDDLRIGLVTNHLPLGMVTESLTKELLRRKIQVMNKTLKVDFGIERPSIAVLGLNPHAGDDGVIGDEEENIIRPVIIEIKKKGTLVMGPYPADGFFGSGTYRKFDGILAIYHDQGLIPFKALSFGDGVNFTAGLPGVRTSPDHGTAFDIAGENKADPSSFRRALFLAIDIAKSRRDHEEMHANPLRKRKHYQEDEDPSKIVEEKEGSQ
ncbi:MAG: 4-hydroxythreonine-4-phosphate dehydrogenase PdxA [Bacteroidota bacterium]